MGLLAFGTGAAAQGPAPAVVSVPEAEPAPAAPAVEPPAAPPAAASAPPALPSPPLSPAPEAAAGPAAPPPPFTVVPAAPAPPRPARPVRPPPAMGGEPPVEGPAVKPQPAPEPPAPPKIRPEGPERPTRPERDAARRGPSTRAPAVHEVYNAVPLRWGEVRAGLGVQGVGLLPRLELGTALAADLAGLPNVYGRAQLLDWGPVDLGLVGVGLRARGGVELDAYRAGLRLSLRPAGPLELSVGGARAALVAQGLPAEGSALASVVGSEDAIVDRVMQAIEEQRPEAVGAVSAPRLQARAAGQQRSLSAAIGWHLTERHQLLVQASAASALSADLRAAFMAEGYARLVPLPAAVAEALPRAEPGAALLAQTLAASLCYQLDLDGLRLRVGGGFGWPARLGWVPTALELSWRPGPPRGAGAP